MGNIKNKKPEVNEQKIFFHQGLDVERREKGFKICPKAGRCNKRKLETLTFEENERNVKKSRAQANERFKSTKSIHPNQEKYEKANAPTFTQTMDEYEKEMEKHKQEK